MHQFINRQDAALQLIPHLKKYAEKPNVILLAIPRGGLQIGAVIRDELKLPLDIVVTKKIGAPGNSELAIGAIDPEGKVILNHEAIMSLNIPEGYIEKETDRLKILIKKRYQTYRGKRPLPILKGKTVIVLDDGIATGLTTMSAIQYIRRHQPESIILAVPLAARDAAAELSKLVDSFICLIQPEDFYAVGQFYQEFPQVENEEAIRLLKVEES
jgi:predicted phosphoribosyltransferase